MSAIEIDRRGAAFRLAALTLAPVIPVGVLKAAAPRTGVAGTYTLTREIKRELRTGIFIEVVRNWTVNFEAREDAITVTGRQVSAEVAAPQVLAPLAELERRRDASTLFPIVLDPSGLIVRAGNTAGDTLARGVDTARSLFSSIPRGSQFEETSPAGLLSQIAAMSAAAVSQLPRDLFFPLPGSAKEERTIDLPDGGEGHVRITAFAEAFPISGLLETSSREIVTTVAGQSREARETWRMTRT